MEAVIGVSPLPGIQVQLDAPPFLVLFGVRIVFIQMAPAQLSAGWREVLLWTVELWKTVF